MPAPEQRAYARALRDIATRYGRMEADTIRRSVQLLREMRERLQARLTTAERFDAARLQEMTRAVDDLVAGYEAQLLALSNSSLRSAANLGASSVTEPLAAAGVSFGFFQPTPAQLNVLLDFSADLIRNIGRETRQAINTEIRLAALGERSTIDAMKRITQRLGLKAGRQVVGGVAVRGETILRTEMGRVFNVANHSQMEVTAQSVPGLQKQWIATGDNRTRLAHLVAHGQIVAYDEPFKLGRERLMFPLDPNGSAAMTINCRCRMVTVHPEIGPIGGPEDARIEKELERRDTAVPVAKPEEVPALPKAEELIRGRDKEVAYAYDRNGKLLFRETGGRDYIDLTREQLDQLRGATLTHNHPDPASFSRSDIKLALNNGLSEIRAVDGKYRYSFQISPDNTLKWGDIADVHQQALENAAQVYRRRVLKGTISLEDAALEVEDQAWQFVAFKWSNQFTYTRTPWDG